MHNLVLKTDVLQQEFSLPFSLVSGRIHELHIQVPWTKIMSEPIVVTIDTIGMIFEVMLFNAGFVVGSQYRKTDRHAMKVIIRRLLCIVLDTLKR